MSEPVEVAAPCSNYGYAVSTAAAVLLVGAGWYLRTKPKQEADDDFTLV